MSGKENINTDAGLITTLRADSASSVTIENCYSDATVTHADSIAYNAGGLIGSLDAVDKYSDIESSIQSTPGTLTVKNSVYLGDLVAGEFAGKIVGAVYRDEKSGEITLDKLYAIDNVELSSFSSNDNVYNGITVSSSDAVTQAFYEDILGWDFDTVWKMDATISQYPILQQLSTPEPVEEYTILFNANGGTGSMTSATVSAGDTYTLPECTFTAPDGQKFEAWLIGSTEYKPGDYYTPTASITVKAVWTATDVPAPGSFTINMPVNGAVSWTDSEGATGYKFSLRDRTISETEDIGKKVNNKDVGDTLSYDISSYLVDGHAYRVAVCAYNDAGERWEEAEFTNEEVTNEESSVELLYVGGVDALTTPSGTGWSYDASSNTLTLNNAEISGTESTSDNRHAVYVRGDITIELIGTNTISGNYAYSDGIYADGNITIIGDGSLTVSGWDVGIYGSNEICIKNVTITTGVGNQHYGILSGCSLSAVKNSGIRK